MNKKLGEILKKARENKGLSQDDVVKRLRLKLQIIQDIENDHYENISALVYMRGYLRAYSRLLGLNEDEILLAFSELGIADPIKSTHDPRLGQLTNHDEIVVASFPWARWSLFALLGLLILTALIIGLNQGKIPTKTASLPVKLLQEPPVAITLPTNPIVKAPTSSVVAVLPPKAMVENSTVAPPAPDENSAELEKPQKPKVQHIKHHRSENVAHNVLKPNYTLSPISDPDIN